MGNSSAFLTLNHVTKHFGGVAALNDVSLEIERGEFISFLGPSGCGKTTTLRTIAGFIEPDAGEILLEGRVLSSARQFVPPDKRNLGMVFQSYAVWPHMTVRQNVELPLKARRMPAKQIKEWSADALRLCHLEGFEDREPHQLSGGQLQRVALARALAYKPPLILLDEPLSNLDIALREQLRAELHRLHQATRATFILVTHDQVEAMSLSDRIVVMNGGTIEQIGAPDEVYRHPVSEFVANFVGSANFLSGTLEEAGSQSWRVAIAGQQLNVPSHVPGSPGARVTLAIHPEAVSFVKPGETVGEVADRLILPGVIKHAQFLGRMQEFTVSVDGADLRVVQMRAGDAPSAGQKVTLAINRDSIVPVGVKAGEPSA